MFHTGPEATFTEWEIKDINADGYPDVIFNSSPVVLHVPVPDPQPGDQENAVKGFRLEIKVQPKAGLGNIVKAVFNTRGMLLTNTALNPFSIPVDLRRNTVCGVAEWAESIGTQHVVCGLADVNGDGLPDRVEDRNIFLGTGRSFSSIHLTLPGTLAMQRSPQVERCSPPHPGTTTYFAGQEIGLRDLTGDGIPDYIQRESNGWQVSIGTGTGFARPVAVEVLGSGFSLSAQKESCDGKLSKTVSGLYDIDGDGKPEVVSVNAQNLDVYQLRSGTAFGTPEAGRLEQVDNGYGAKTTITYRSAKEDRTTLHQVPFPEVVVTSVETTGTQGLGGTLSATRFAYGNAELMFDSARDAFTLPAYGRVVELHILPKPNPTDRTEVMATLTDTYPLARFVISGKDLDRKRSLVCRCDIWPDRDGV